MYIALFLLICFAAILAYLRSTKPTLPPETDMIIDDVLNSDLPEFVVGQTGYATSDGLRIWYECIAPEGPTRGTVLLLVGSGGSALDWPPKFVQTFVDAGYQTIRYDNRGTGISDRVQNWSRKNSYSIVDMAGDATAVLDALNIPQAHLIGLSMGGMIAQEVAIAHPDRIASLTLLSTSGFIGDPDLPSLTSSYLLTSFAKGIPLLKYRILGGERNLIKERLAKVIAFIGYEDLDIRETAELVLYDLRKRSGVSISGVFQHQVAVTVSGSRYDRLKTLRVPTLVVHGTDDPIIPLAHGKKLVEIIPKAESLWLDGVGHALPYPHMDMVYDGILSHLGQHAAE
ncbi:MAG: alpha/beta hydrolase [Anaerolineae bacterium]|nr:alpha/beta hydrolase [Anaerolineae bacterium]